jgi:hypothetical protein
VLKLQWTITAELTDVDTGVRYQRADTRLRWADSFATQWNPGHLGHALQLALIEAKQRAFPGKKVKHPYRRSKS